MSKNKGFTPIFGKKLEKNLNKEEKEQVKAEFDKIKKEYNEQNEKVKEILEKTNILAEIDMEKIVENQYLINPIELRMKFKIDNGQDEVTKFNSIIKKMNFSVYDSSKELKKRFRKIANSKIPPEDLENLKFIVESLLKKNFISVLLRNSKFPNSETNNKFKSILEIDQTRRELKNLMNLIDNQINHPELFGEGSLDGLRYNDKKMKDTSYMFIPQ